MNVAILGASPKPDRYAHKAQVMLTENGHNPIPVNPAAESILDRPCHASILDIPEEDRPVHTVTVYMNPKRFAEIADDVLEFCPSRIIFNPGTESPEIEEIFRQAGVQVMQACTLVLLSTNQFD